MAPDYSPWRPCAPRRKAYVERCGGFGRSLDLFWEDSRNGAADIYRGGVSDIPPPDPAPGTSGELLVSGPGFHFPNGFSPGASFCLDQSQSPGTHLGP